jgi:hypothetical protein
VDDFSFMNLFSQVHLIRDDPIGGIAVEGNKLILRGLRRHHSALYRCRAKNSEGSALSEPLTLNVLCKYTMHRMEKETEELALRLVRFACDRRC